MSEWLKFLEQKIEVVDETTKNWIQRAINPEHKGYCANLNSPTCTPRRKALAKRFKKKGDLHHGKKNK